jgi:hypothetical protein
MNSDEPWTCSRCGQEAETLYSVEGARVCEACCERERREKRMAARALKNEDALAGARRETADDTTRKTEPE